MDAFSEDFTTVRCHRTCRWCVTQWRSRSCFSSSQVTRKIRSPQTIGEAWPLPGMGVFRECFYWHSIRSGYSFPARTVSRGPRQPGQFSAERFRLRMSNANRTDLRMGAVCGWVGYAQSHLTHGAKYDIMHVGALQGIAQGQGIGSRQEHGPIGAIGWATSVR